MDLAYWLNFILLLKIISMSSQESWLPKIDFDTEAGVLKLSGRSIPEDPRVVYLPLLQKVEEYCTKPAHSTNIELGLEFINTSSIKWLFNILTLFEKLHDDTHTVTITFKCGDESLVGTAKFLAAHLVIPVQIVKV